MSGIIPSDATPDEIERFLAAHEEMDRHDDTYRERALSAEAEVRALRETVVELLEVLDDHGRGCDICHLPFSMCECAF